MAGHAGEGLQAQSTSDEVLHRRINVKFMEPGVNLCAMIRTMSDYLQELLTKRGIGNLKTKRATHLPWSEQVKELPESPCSHFEKTAHSQALNESVICGFDGLMLPDIKESFPNSKNR